MVKEKTDELAIHLENFSIKLDLFFKQDRLFSRQDLVLFCNESIKRVE